LQSKKRKATPWSLWKWLGFASDGAVVEQEGHPNKRRRIN
jgi:hypothetical protein